jgi:membrane associated rhomboid family serine protease
MPSFGESYVATGILLLTIGTSLIAWQFHDLFQNFALHPWSLFRRRRYYTLLTSGLIHADGAHLILNMLSFYFFAFTLEQFLGHLPFFLLYTLSLILSDITTVIKRRDDPDYFCVGASGAVTAVIFSFIIYEPTSSIYLMFIPIPIPAPIFGLIYIGYSYYSAKYRQTRINHAAHLWGAVSGLLLTLIFDAPAFRTFFEILAGRNPG